MQEKYTKKQIEEIYNCKVTKEDDFYTAYGKLDENGQRFFEYADGWNLDELHNSIRENLIADCILEEVSKQNSYKVITLCGSTKFKDEFIKVQKDLTLRGNIVISVGLFGHSGDVITDEQKIMLDDMHKRKIDMADEIFVIDVDGYIGESTKSEIEYAKSTGKPIKYYSEEIQSI